MKKFYSSRTKLGFALLVLLLTISIGAKSNPVDAEKARLVAKNFLNINDARSAGLRDVSAEAEFSNVYVFTTEKSFVLVAADDRVQPILGYSLNGGFDLENMPENKAAWIKAYGDGIRYAIDHQVRASTEVLQLWNDLAAGVSGVARATNVVNPLIQTKWNQGNPYNLLCPSGSVTGCVATAMAQVMKYWNYPEHGISSHTYTHADYGDLTADFQNTTYDWTHMTNTYSSSSTNAQKMAVATLMYHCGVSVNMNYSPSSSGAVTAFVADALKNYFNYSSDVQYHDRDEFDDATWISMLKNDLNLGRPIQYCGSGSGGGHSFVFDGYNSNNYFHVNWGWGGSCDEYYSVDNLNPGPGGIGSGSYGVYNERQGAIFGIHPSECTANAPTNLTYTQNGRNITLSWSAASGAASYNIYRDNELIGNVSANSYSDLAFYGNSSYIVRSMDSNGWLSLSSNIVTVTVDYQVPVVDDLAVSVSGNNVNLSWTAPEWCYPQTPSQTLSYGVGGVHFSWTYVYYAHRYPASMMAQYVNKAIYKVSTFIQYPGTYTVYIYTNSTSSNKPDANALAATKTIEYRGTSAWHDIVLNNPITLTAAHDLWVVMKQENTGQTYPTPSFNLSSYNADACYAGSSPTSVSSITGYTISWLIQTCLTDGTYTYNIYRDNMNIAGNVNGTSYNDNHLAPGTYNYYIKTNYYAGESGASNQVSALIGAGNYFSITASANPPEAGSVTGAGSYLEGNTCTLTATANTGYYFVNWTKDGEVVSTDASFSFSVTQAASYIANFREEEIILPVAEVVAKYYPDATDPNSPFVKVYWSMDIINFWLYYDDGLNQGGVGTGGGQFYWGVMFPANSHTGNSLTKVSMYDHEAHTGTIMIYQGGTTAPASLLYTQSYSCTGLGDFVEWTLNSPVAIDPSKSLWIVLHNDNGNYPASGCANSGDPNGRWVSLDGATWEDVTGYGLDYTWMLRAYVSSERGTTILGCPSPVNHNIATGNVTLMSDPNAIPHFVGIPAQANGNNRSFSHYRVYRTDAYNNGPYTEDNTVLIADNVTDSYLIENTWSNADAGVYKFGVSRIYEREREEIESPIVWSNSLDKDMNLGANDVNITVTLNSGDSPAGVTVSLTNLNQVEQSLYPIADVTLDASGYYAWGSFRKGDYQVQVSFDDYNTITENVSIWDATDLNYVLSEIYYSLSNLYVSRTGWAMWTDNYHGNAVPSLDKDYTFFVDFDDSQIPDGWTTIDADGDGYNWMLLTQKMSGTGNGHNGSNDGVLSQSYDVNNGGLYPDNYFVSPQCKIVDGSTFSFWACAQDASYAAEHFGVAISTSGNTNASDFTTIYESTIGSKVGRSDGSRNTREQTNWTQYFVDLSAYAGQKVYIAIRHFNSYDQFYLDVDDIRLSIPCNTEFKESFDGGLNGWTTIDADGDGHNWYHNSEVDNHNTLAIPSHSGAGHMMSESYCNHTGVLYPDEYLVSPQMYSITNGSTLSLWACTQDEMYPSEHFGVAISTSSNTYAADFTTIKEWTLTAKDGSRSGSWYQYTADLSAYAGKNVWIAIRHFNTSDQFIINVDDIELTASAKANRHFNNYQVELSGTQDDVIYQGTTSDSYMQLPVDNLIDGQTYHLKVAVVYSSGLSEWSETDWTYQSCDNYEGVTDLNMDMNDDANVISWTYPGTTALGAMLYRDGELLGFTTQTSYTDAIADGNHEYEVRVVYNGNRQCPDLNTYYAMSCPQTIGGEHQHEEDFAAGWNWWSTYVDLSQIDGLEMLEESLGSNGYLIKSNVAFVQNAYATMGTNYWFGNLSDISNDKFYKVNTTSPCTVAMAGGLANPSHYPITINSGWNWIGFPSATALSIETAFTGFTPTDNDVLKSQTSFAIYYENSGWFPNSFVLNPGDGFMYYSASSSPKTLTFSSVRDAENHLVDNQTYWKSNVYRYADNASIIATANLDGMELAENGYEVSAFVNGECRGSGKLIYAEPVGRYVVMLSVSGNDGDNLSFALYDANGKKAYCYAAESVSFAADALYGLLDNPMALHFNSETGVSEECAGTMTLFPNPVERGGETVIAFPDGQETPESIEIINVYGEIVRKYSGRLTNRVKCDVNSGVYMVRVVMENDKVYIDKLIVK